MGTFNGVDFNILYNLVIFVTLHFPSIISKCNHYKIYINLYETQNIFRDGSYIFPEWADELGWCIASSSVLVILPFTVYEIYKVNYIYI